MLVAEINETENVAYVRLAGIIDEDNGLADLTRKLTKPIVIINTADVDRINSCGVRDWVTWLNEIEKKKKEPCLVECSPAIMTQVNLVNNFVGSGTILSFYAPYFCSACNTDKMLLIDVEQAPEGAPFRAPTCRCDQCDHQMEFDDIETSYFAFLTTIRRKKIDRYVTETIRRFSSDRDSRLRARTASVAATNTGLHAQQNSTPSQTGSSPFKGMLSESVTFTPAKPQTAPAASTNKLLFVIVGLLVAAIGLLAYVILRTG